MAFVNAQRSQSGLFGDVRERPEWSDACRRHDDYELAHGGDLTHDEADTSSPAYSPEGAFAADNSVLADEDAWTAAGPWFDAPVHRHQFYTPLLTETGVDDHGGVQCAIAGPAYNRALPAGGVWTMPGRRGQRRRGERAGQRGAGDDDPVRRPPGRDAHRAEPARLHRDRAGEDRLGLP